MGNQGNTQHREPQASKTRVLYKGTTPLKVGEPLSWDIANSVAADRFVVVTTPDWTNYGAVAGVVCPGFGGKYDRDGAGVWIEIYEPNVGLGDVPIYTDGNIAAYDLLCVVPGFRMFKKWCGFGVPMARANAAFNGTTNPGTVNCWYGVDKTLTASDRQAQAMVFDDDFHTVPSLSATANLAGYKLTNNGTGTGGIAVLRGTGGKGGLLEIFTSNSSPTDNDSTNLRKNGTPFLLDKNSMIIWGGVTTPDVDKTDIAFGLAVNDNEVLGGATDHIYLRIDDGAASQALTIYLRKATGTAQAISTGITMTDGSTVTVAVFYDADKAAAYWSVNGGAWTAFTAAQLAQLPNTVALGDFYEVRMNGTGITVSSAIDRFFVGIRR